METKQASPDHPHLKGKHHTVAGHTLKLMSSAPLMLIMKIGIMFEG